MSGCGRSTLVAALVDRCHRAVDLDDRECSEYRVLDEDDVAPGVEPGRDLLWHEDRVAALMRSVGDLVVETTEPVEATLQRLLDLLDP
jgi:hypothetical protein